MFAIFLLFGAFLQTRAVKLKTAVEILLVQSVIISFACLYIGWETGEMHMFIAAFLTFAIKAVLIPYALMQLVRRLRQEKERNPVLSPNAASLAAATVIFFSYILIDRALPGILSRDALAAAVSLILIGLLLIMTRHQAMMQTIGLITMENGLYLVGLSVTKGLPLIIELGIFVDVLVAVLVLVILTYRLKLSFSSTDTSVLEELKG